MKKLCKTNFQKIETDELRKITGGAQVSDRTYSTYVTCDNGAGSDTYTVYYIDGNVQYTEYEDNISSVNNSCSPKNQK